MDATYYYTRFPRFCQIGFLKIQGMCREAGISDPRLNGAQPVVRPSNHPRFSVNQRLLLFSHRSSLAYKRVYKQRTATERINSQAVELGVERAKLRNAGAITRT